MSERRPRSLNLTEGALLLCFLVFSVTAFAEEKLWTGDGDTVSWEDDSNWDPSGKPGAQDDVIIDVKNAQVVSSETFQAQSLIVGGRKNPLYKTQDFISGEIDPEDVTKDAVHIRKGGQVVSTGEGVITLKGTFRNTEKPLDTEPAFMFSVE